MRCPNCNTENPPDGRLCIDCGEELPTDEDAPESPWQSQSYDCPNCGRENSAAVGVQR